MKRKINKPSIFLFLFLGFAPNLFARNRTADLAYFDSVARKIPPKSYVIAGQKIQEITYTQPDSFEVEEKFHDEDGRFIDTGEYVNGTTTSILIKINDSIYESATPDDIGDPAVPSLQAIKKAFPLPGGRLGLIIYVGDQGRSAGNCGAANWMNLEILAIGKKKPVESIFQMHYGSCEHTSYKIGKLTDDSSIAFTPDTFYWENNSLVFYERERDSNGYYIPEGENNYTPLKTFIDFFAKRKKLVVQINYE